MRLLTCYISSPDPALLIIAWERVRGIKSSGRGSFRVSVGL